MLSIFFAYVIVMLGSYGAAVNHITKASPYKILNHLHSTLLIIIGAALLIYELYKMHQQ